MGAKKEKDESLGRALKEVAKSIRVQKRHFVFWMIIILFFVGLLLVARYATNIFASTPDIREQIDSQTSVYTIDVAIGSDGRTVVDGRDDYKIFKPLGEIDELKYKILDKPQTFIDQMIVRIRFVAPIPEGVRLQSFAVHGIELATEKQVDEHTIEYIATGIGPEASYTIAALLPSGSIDWPWWRQAAATLATFPPAVWLAMSVTLPLLTFVMLLLMFRTRVQAFFKGNPQQTLEHPPVLLPPALAGIVVNGRISSREIAATLLDLANRGYVTIFNRGNGEFSFAKRRPWQGLHSFELLLLTQMFEMAGYKTTGEEVETAIGSRIFSPQISKVYIAMYDAVTQAGYFEHNPAAVHQRYRFTGFVLFFLGLLAFASVLVFEIQPSYLTFLFAGVMTMALVIILAADSVPLRTPAGNAARLQWLAFRNYLATPTPLGYIEGAQDYYENYLPYAVALKTEITWARRFEQFPFKVPDWYGSVEQSIALEDFANGLYGIVGGIARLFANAKEPTVH